MNIICFFHLRSNYENCCKSKGILLVSNLAKQVVRGVKWTSVSMVTSTALQLIQIFILARFLQPEDFGLMAMVMVVLGFSQIFTQVGLAEAIVQKKSQTQFQLASLYWFNVLFSIILYMVVFLTSPLVAAGFGEPALNKILPLAAVSILIISFGSQYQALAQKSLHFKHLAVIDLTGALVTFLVSVLCAWILNLGIWALIYGYLCGVIVRTILLVLHGHRNYGWPIMHFSITDVSGYIEFGLHRFGALCINYINTKLDQLIIGALFGSQTLGFYSMAVNLVLLPIQKINPIVTRVAFPAFCLIQDEIKSLRKSYFNMLRMLMLIIAPILLGVTAVAPIAVPVLLGEKWAPIVIILQGLSIYALFRSIGNAGGSVIIAKGYAKWTLYWNIGLFFIIGPVVYMVGLVGEIENIVFALIVMQALLSVAHYYVFIRKIFGGCYKAYFKAIMSPITLAFVMYGAVSSLCMLIPCEPSISVLTIQILIGVILYAFLVWCFSREHLTTNYHLLTGRDR